MTGGAPTSTPSTSRRSAATTRSPPARLRRQLAVTFDGGEGTDTTTYSGTSGDDTIGIARTAPPSPSSRPGAGAGQQRAVENLEVRGLAGDDTIAGQNGIGTLTHLTIDGGAGNDTLGGGDGDDLLIGGAGNDLVDGNRGNDTALLGAGDDNFQWDPGDGSDIVEGQGGNDTMQFNGSNAAEKIDLSANGPRLRLTRDVAAITMDIAGIENVNVRTLGSADTVTVNDLSGTDVKRQRRPRRVRRHRRRRGRHRHRQRHRRGRDVEVSSDAGTDVVSRGLDRR